jgi:hypothetical protein
LETPPPNHQLLYNEAYQMLVLNNCNGYEAIAALQQLGASYAHAAAVVDEIEATYGKAYKRKAKKEMLYGALWCIGGLALSLANIGAIFYGAIIVGGIQFLKGLYAFLK